MASLGTTEQYRMESKPRMLEKAVLVEVWTPNRFQHKTDPHFVGPNFRRSDFGIYKSVEAVLKIIGRNRSGRILPKYLVFVKVYILTEEKR